MRVFIITTLVLASFALLTPGSTAVNAGLGVSIGQATVEGFKVLIPDILGKLGGTELPSMTVKGFTLSDLTLDSFQMEEKYLAYGTPATDQATLDVTNMNLDLSFNFKGKFLFIPVEGHVVAKSDDTTMTNRITFGNDNGKLTIDVNQIDVKIGSLAVTLSGNFGDEILSKLADVFHDIVTDVVNDEINDMLKTQASSIVKKLLTAIPDYIPLEIVPISLSSYIASGPTINPDIVAFGLEAEVVPTKDTTIKQDVPAPAMPVWDKTGQQVQVFVNEFVANSALKALGYLGVNVTVSGAIIPKALPISLNVANFNEIFPGSIDKYGYDTPLLIEAIIDDALDTITITPDGIDFSVGAELKFKAEGKEGKEDAVTFADVKIQIAGTATIDIAEQKIKFTLPKLEASDATLVSTTLDADLIEENLLGYFNALMIIGQEFAGLLIPGAIDMATPQGISLQDTSVSMEEGYLLIQAKPAFQPELFSDQPTGPGVFWYYLLNGQFENAAKVIIKNSYGM